MAGKTMPGNKRALGFIAKKLKSIRFYHMKGAVLSFFLKNENKAASGWGGYTKQAALPVLVGCLVWVGFSVYFKANGVKVSIATQSDDGFCFMRTLSGLSFAYRS